MTLILRQCLEALEPLTVEEKLHVLSQAFSAVTSERIPGDFLTLVCRGMGNLRNAGRSNVIYLLARAVGTI